MSWEQLISIYAEADAERQAELASRPVACPECGTPLESGPKGELHCRFDGWRSG